MTLTQPLPAALEQVTVASQRVGSLAISSPQFSTVGDVKAEDGTSFILASGNALPAGGVLSVQICGTPGTQYHPSKRRAGAGGGHGGSWVSGRHGRAAERHGSRDRTPGEPA